MRILYSTIKSGILRTVGSWVDAKAASPWKGAGGCPGVGVGPTITASPAGPGDGEARFARLGGSWSAVSERREAGKGEIRTRRRIGTSTTSGNSDRDVTAGGGCSDVAREGLVALGAWGGSTGGAMEGSPENVLGTTSGRGASSVPIRLSQ